MDFPRSSPAGYSTLSPHKTGGSGTQTQQELEEEVARSRADRAKRRSRLSGGAAMGSGIANRTDGLPSSTFAASSMDAGAGAGAGADAGAGAGANRSSAGLLARYGGAAGPTGHASANAAGPTSLASFIGGKAAGPRLGKLAGDGRSAPPEYQGATSASEVQQKRALHGMVVGPAGGMAGMMEARKRELANREGQSAGDVVGKTQLERRQTSPTRPSAMASARPELPEPARASTTSSTTIRTQSPSILKSEPLRPASPERKRSWDAPLRASGAVLGGGSSTSTTSNTLRSPSPTRTAISPTRSWQTPLRPASPERHSQPKVQTPALAQPKSPSPSAIASPNLNTTQKVSPAFSPQTPSSAEKPPSASITRLRGRSMVQQRLREAQEREAGSNDSDAAPSLVGDLPQRSGVKKWAPPVKTASASSLPVPMQPPTSQTNTTVPTQTRKWTVPAVKADEASQTSSQKAWTPGKGAQMLPGLGAPRSATEGAAAGRSPSPTRIHPLPVRDPSPERVNIAPIRLPGMGGAVSPFKPRSPVDPDPAEQLAAQKETSEQKLTHLAAGRAKGPKKSARKQPSTQAAAADSTILQGAASDAVSTPVGESIRASHTQTGDQGTTSSILAPPPQDDDPTISRLLGSEQDTFQAIKPSDRASADSTGRMSVREVEEGIRAGLPEAGKQRSTSGKRICVLISGNGSNLQALIDATLLDRDELPNAQISLVVSNRKAAYGLQRAAGANPPIPTLVSALKTYQNKNPGATREEYDEDLALKVMNAHEGLAPDLIVLAGFMHIVSPTFLRAFGHETSEAPGIAPAWAPARGVPIINLHPALPGAFDGAGAIERAYEAFKEGKVDKTGIMVHEVIAEVDRGAPVIVQEIPMRKGESLQELQERMHSVEHGLIVAGAREILQRELQSKVKVQSQEIVNPWATSTVPAKAPSLLEETSSHQTPIQNLPPRPSAPTPVSATFAHARPPAESAFETVDSNAQFASVRDSIAAWGQPTQVSSEDANAPTSAIASAASGSVPPLSSSSGSAGSGAVPRPRRRTLSRPSSVYGGSSPLPDLIEQPEGSVAEAAARWDGQSSSVQQSAVRTRKISSANRPQTMYAAVPPQNQLAAPRDASAAPTRSDSVKKLETQAAQLGAFVNDRSGTVGFSPVSPVVATPTSQDLVKLDLLPISPAPFDAKAFASEHARLMQARSAYLKQLEDVRNTLSVEVISVLPNGSTVTIPEAEQHILYEGETLAVIHRRREASLVRTELFIRTGRASSATNRGPAETARIQDLAKRFNTSVVEVRVGDEPKGLIDAFPQGIVSRFGSRARWDEQSTILYEIRVLPNGATLIEQVDLETSSLCSAFGYIASVVGSPFLWHGLGTTENERESTRALVAPLFSGLFSHDEAEIDVAEYIEGSEDATFWAYFDQEVPYAQSALHAVASADSYTAKGAILYDVRDAKVTPRLDQTYALKSASAHDMDPKTVQIVHSSIETYVLIGQEARSSRQDIDLALRAAETLASSNSTPLTESSGKASQTPAHVVIFPSALPLELKKLLRGWNAAPPSLLEVDSISLMNVLNLRQARTELERHSFDAREVRDLNWLPCGVAPSNVEGHF